ncbi:MAG: LacI family DNA-binding transcriptional regulator [Sphingobacteriaceae bacterium]|nr:LacI family DNA-binding transcriptional regulator [Sphingobacteriaceae bacterium]
MKKKLSIRDIANHLNISKTTVSFILNGKAKEKRISDVLTEKVLKYIEEKDFKPNQLAKSLSTGKTMIIGLMVEKISDYFFAKVAYHLEELAYQNGYKIIYCSTENDTEKTKELIKLFHDRQVDGYIITPPVGIEDEIRELISENLPVVLFDRYLPALDTSYVGLDNFGGTYNAVKHLIKCNYKNIAFVELESDQTQMHDRQQGYLKAIEENKLEPIIKKISFQNTTAITVDELTGLLQKQPEIDAMFFATNYLAMSGIKAINQLNLKIPDNIAVIAFDDHDVFDIYNPSITAVAQPIDEMAKELINILLDKMESRTEIAAVKKVEVPARLILRNSTRNS